MIFNTQWRQSIGSLRKVKTIIKSNYSKRESSSTSNSYQEHKMGN